MVLTSVDDDSIGGDTRNDGPTEGTPGDWRQVHVSADGSVFDDVLVRFAGWNGSDAVRIVGADTQLHRVLVQDCGGDALAIPGSTPLVSGCSFDRNAFAVDEASFRALPGFSNDSASDNTLGDFIRVTNGMRNELIEQLRACQIETGFHYTPNHLLRFFATDYRLPAAEALGRELVTLPLHAELTQDEQQRVIAEVKRILGSRTRRS